MILRKIPIVATPISLLDATIALFNIFNKHAQEECRKKLSSFLDRKNVFTLNSGSSCLYVILDALKQISDAKEVIIPAYTASALVNAVHKAGLKPILVDIALDDFGFNETVLSEAVNDNTLCIVGVHLFGIVSTQLKKIKETYPKVYLIEDCAQAFGSQCDHVSVGAQSDISFFSFNRGKNTPAYGGGAIATDDTTLSDLISQSIGQYPSPGVFSRILLGFKSIALSLVVRPLVYGPASRLIQRFKEQPSPEDFTVMQFTNVQASIILSLLRKIERLSHRRYSNAKKILVELRDNKNLILPNLAENTASAFNRLPIIFKDLGALEKAEQQLLNSGIECSRMYFKPLHHSVNLGYKREEFPDSVYFAEHLLTVPVHPYVTDDDIAKIVKAVNQCEEQA